VETLKAVAPGIVIRELKLKGRSPNGHYKIEGSVEGIEIELKIAVNGLLLELEMEDNNSNDGNNIPVNTDTLPQAVLETLAEVVPGLLVTEIESKGRASGLHFEIEGHLEDGSEIEIKLAADGTIRKIERDGRKVGAGNGNDDDETLTEADLPQAVLDTLAEAAPGIVISEIEQKGNDNGGLFEIEGSLENGARVEIKISHDGEVRKLKIDSDYDGLGDAEEVEHGSDPNDPDTDDDVFPDGFEQNGGGDPNDADSRPDIADPELTDGGTTIMIIVDTVEGIFFQLEHCTDDAGEMWEPLGDEFPGTGLPVEFSIERGDLPCGMIRVKVRK
jgi:hypothetical protein